MVRITLGDRTWMFDEEKMSNFEAIALKKTTGIGPKELLIRAGMDDPEAHTALLWLARRRAGETDLKYSELEFNVMQYDWEPVDEQNRVLRFHEDGSIKSRDGVPEAEIQAALTGAQPDGDPDPTQSPAEATPTT